MRIQLKDYYCKGTFQPWILAFGLFFVCLFPLVPFILFTQTGLNVDTSAGFEKPPHSFLRGSNAHTASVPRSAITKTAFLYASPPVIVLTTMGAIDGFESMDFCG